MSRRRRERNASPDSECSVTAPSPRKLGHGTLPAWAQTALLTPQNGGCTPLIELADSAAELGVERCVLDDGWFRGGHDGRASVHEQTLAAYRLFGELRTAHPGVEI